MAKRRCVTPQTVTRRYQREIQLLKKLADQLAGEKAGLKSDLEAAKTQWQTELGESAKNLANRGATIQHLTERFMLAAYVAKSVCGRLTDSAIEAYQQRNDILNSAPNQMLDKATALRRTLLSNGTTRGQWVKTPDLPDFGAEFLLACKEVDERNIAEAAKRRTPNDADKSKDTPPPGDG